MATAWPQWDYSTIDHRGHWVAKREEGHRLSGFALMHRYHFDGATEGLPDAEVECLERTRAQLRRARARGYLNAEAHLNAEELEFLSEACRCEGIPVLADYPFSMRPAVRSYGELLATLFFINPLDATGPTRAMINSCDSRSEMSRASVLLA
jgi:hypothetical protein